MSRSKTSISALILFICTGNGSKAPEFPVRSLMPETAALLLDWVKDKQPEDYLFPAGRASAVPHITRVRFFQLFGDYCRQAGIPALLSHPHCLKHALATHVINTIGIQHTRQYLGHVSIRSTQQYLHSNDARASLAVQTALMGAA